MTTGELIEKLKDVGYDAAYDDSGAVMVRLDPAKQSAEELIRIVLNVFKWPHSFGISYTSKPGKWQFFKGKKVPKQPESQKAVADPRREEEQPAAAVGRQMSIFDYL